uniref:Uncharacterized protein n=1 Tax=Anguilla anguilla TaxID=7936 RepID=A0A0E9X887_ANGAN
MGVRKNKVCRKKMKKQEDGKGCTWQSYKRLLKIVEDGSDKLYLSLG